MIFPPVFDDNLMVFPCILGFIKALYFPRFFNFSPLYVIFAE